MALYEMTGESLKAIDPKTFTELGLLERQNIQKALRTHIAAITPNVKTMVLAEEFGDWVGANRRIDLLCLDDQANLVVVELKRDDAAHMELQALRYAAMISTIRFEQAVEAHRRYLLSVGSNEDPAQAIRDFLDVEEGDAVALSDKVRIVLASAEFSPELTTAVLWLNKQGLDLRCVQMRPHQIGDRVLLDIQQVIPLPQAEQYQVAVREKSFEQDAARVQDRDLTRYDLTVGDNTYPNLPKRRLMLGVVAEAIRQGMSISDIEGAVDWRETMFISADGTLNGAQLTDALGGKKLRYFTEDDELFHSAGRTYALSKMWGERTLEAIGSLLGRMPHSEFVTYAPTSGIADEITYGHHVIRRRESGAIEVEKDGVPVVPVMPALRELATRLQVQHLNGSGNALNTRQLGKAVIEAVRDQ
ncbi:hypothetical protein [Paraburkholderia caledonica]|uniref:DUF91 domain-containing protein n=1 Tax=Paraburkholderia caledonica TaxID=134536 RepID=A0AB73ILL9_9BURK|nr:hypothetical protein [Paraburkholderia caledonica]